MVLPAMRPSFLMSFMLQTDIMMEKKTMGTMASFNALVNTV